MCRHGQVNEFSDWARFKKGFCLTTYEWIFGKLRKEGGHSFGKVGLWKQGIFRTVS